MKKLLIILLTGLFIIGITIPMQAQKNNKPNIILLNMDNFGYGDISLYATAVINKDETGKVKIKQVSEDGPIGNKSYIQ